MWWTCSRHQSHHAKSLCGQGEVILVILKAKLPDFKKIQSNLDSNINVCTKRYILSLDMLGNFKCAY